MSAFVTASCRVGSPFDRPAPNTVRFEISPQASGAPGEQRFECRYGSGAAVARFGFRMVVRSMAHGTEKDADRPRFEFGEGAIEARPGSEAGAMIGALCAALQAGTCPEPGTARTGRLEFRLAVLGRELSRKGREGRIEGSFSSQPKGGWMAMKLFLNEGEEQEAEVFFNLNPTRGIGEFALKDPEYGTVVVRQLARVL